jgi:wyosine [tRNA(Phe)-imidazoG37] synthetase (radical SAM superfamily)
VSKYTFGPVISRRLGKSLGVNNIPYKTCTYSCTYCQLGRTEDFTIERRSFYDWREIVSDVVKTVNDINKEVDYITFVPDGEPLLDINIGLEIDGIKKEESIPVAVITNSSLLYLKECREDLFEANLVSVKVDSVEEKSWRKINRPYPKLSFDKVLEGIEEFSKQFKGKLITETMLIEGSNTDREDIDSVALFIKKLNPYKAYISIPIRPPAEAFVKPPEPVKIVEAHEIFNERLGEGKVELLNLPEPPPLSVHGDPATWLLSVTSVHPQRIEYAINSLKSVVEKPEELIAKLESEGLIRIVEYSGSKFVVRWFEKEKKAKRGTK